MTILLQYTTATVRQCNLIRHPKAHPLKLFYQTNRHLDKSYQKKKNCLGCSWDAVSTKTPALFQSRKKRLTQEKSKHQLFMEATLDIKLVCLRNSLNAHCIPSELRSTSLQIEKEKKLIIHQPEGVFSITRCATDLSHFHKDIFIY